MTNLLARLAKLAHLTPDEIQSRIGPSKWIRFGDLTDEDFERLADQRMVLVKRHHQTGTLIFDMRPDNNWTFWGHCSAGDRRHFLDALKNYWGILTEDYTDGDLPDPALVEARASES